MGRVGGDENGGCLWWICFFCMFHRMVNFWGMEKEGICLVGV